MREFLRASGRLPVGVLDVEPHGRAPDDPTPSTGPVSESELPGAAELCRLLEAGAGHLAAAKAAQVEQSRQAAVQARELAAFARSRPAVLFDRPEQEVGSAAAASRAARPEALTAISEWAVDEVAAVLCLPGQAAQQLLTESVVLVERLPATLAAERVSSAAPGHPGSMIPIPLRSEPASGTAGAGARCGAGQAR